MEPYGVSDAPSGTAEAEGSRRVSLTLRRKTESFKHIRTALFYGASFDPDAA